MFGTWEIILIVVVIVVIFTIGFNKKKDTKSEEQGNPQEGTPKQVKECPKCHKKGIPANATFCPACGSKL